MEYQKTATSYAVGVDDATFLALLRHDESEFELGHRSLVEELNDVPGLSNVEYSGHFGAFIYFTIEAMYEAPDRQDATRASVNEVINKHLDRATRMSLES